MTATQDKVLDLIFGRWRSQILYAGVKLGVFEALHEGTNDAATIAQELGLNANLCYRLLRALGALDLLREEDGRRFSITGAGRYLLSDHRRICGVSPFWRKAQSTMPYGSTYQI
jgi:predicted transcriptional regulator